MGCFLGCFGGSKDNKRRIKNTQSLNLSHHNPSLGHQYGLVHQTNVRKQENLDGPIDVKVPEFRVKPEVEPLRSTKQIKPDVQQLSSTYQDKPEEQLSLAARKKVTFNSDVKEYEHIAIDEAPEIIQESERGVEQAVAENCPNIVKSSSISESGSTLSSLGSYPPNHRYQNYRESDDEDGNLDCEVSDLEEDEDADDEADEEEVYNDGFSDEYDEYHSTQVQELSARSCSSMESEIRSPMTRLANYRHDNVMPDCGSLEKESKTPPVFHRGARDRAGYVHSVLNPVENTAQWKTVKAKGTSLVKQQKENSHVDRGFKLSAPKLNSKLDELENNPEVAVDASLSTWLVSSQNTPPSKATPIVLEPISAGASVSSYGSNSVRSQDQRPILSALTVEELKQFSATSSPRRSPGRSPNEKPLVGTVGVHWNNRMDRTPVEDSSSASSFKGIPNTTSKYREDKRVNWHSTPFETRLERAINRGAANSHA